MPSSFAEAVLYSRSLKEVLPYGLWVELHIDPHHEGVHVRVCWDQENDWSGWHPTTDAALASARALIKENLNLDFP